MGGELAVVYAEESCIDLRDGDAKGARVSDSPVSERVMRIGQAGSIQLVEDYFVNTYIKSVRQKSDISDFTFGNPHEMPRQDVVEILQRWAVPQDKDWFAYKRSEPNAQAAVAEALTRRFGMPFEPEDIAMTTGGFGALISAMKAVADPGDEVIFSLPPWFINEPIIIESGLVPVKVSIDLETFDLDLDAIAGAITPRTRVLIVNTPHNPTGKIVPPETLRRLADLLEEASQRNGRRIYLLSDEPYNRIIFEGSDFHTPLEFYPYAMVAYSYAKTLMMPGQRIGYLALPPTMPLEWRAALRRAVEGIQLSSGYLIPNALLQHAIEDLEALEHDMEHLTRKRDLMVGSLQEMGYEVFEPEGTFYLFPKSPIADDQAFADMLVEENVAVLPGRVFETPGYFRICLTANDEMIERALPGFKRAMERVG